MAKPSRSVKEQLEGIDPTSATELDLKWCNLTTVPEDIRGLPNLTTLDLANNAIAKWPAWFWEFASLQVLILDGNSLHSIPDEIGSLAGIEELRIHGNQLASLPETIGQLKRLKLLGVSSNRLTKLPISLSSIPNLQAVHASGNPLVSIADIVSVTTLQELRLSGVGMTSLPREVACLSRLRALHLKSNLLTGLPREVCSIASLERLQLDKNALRELPPEIGDLSKLRILDISHNKITSLPREIGKLKNLDRLTADRNAIEFLPDEIGGLESLSLLDLGGNNLRVLPSSIGNLTKLSRLNIAKNNLQSLPPEIGNLKNLRRLLADQNRLSSLPAELGRCKLKSFVLTSITDLRFPPVDVAALGGRAILRYLRAVDEGEEIVWESKLLLVGEGAVGKTWLFEALNGRLSGGTRSGATVGIEIGQLDIASPTREGKMMRLNCWDFAGQDFNHATHQFFFSERTLFILCWSARAGWEAGKLRKWLTNIRDRSPNAKVLLVATHVDQPHSDYPEKELRSEFPQIVGAFKVSSLSGDGVDALRKEIARNAEALPMMGLRWPRSWRLAQQAVHRLRESGPYATRSSVMALLDHVGLDPDDSVVLLRWLHELGELLHYADIPELVDLVMLDPQWVTRHVGTVLASSRVQNANGVLTRSDLQELWPNIEPHVKQHLLGMLDQFDLAYRIPEDIENRCLVVERLSQDPPAYEMRWSGFSVHPEVRLCYRLKSMHPGIPTWFIARCHRFTLGLHWARGVLFGDSRQTPRHLALVTASESERSVTFSVRGPQPWSFLPLLSDGFEDTIRSRYPGLEFERKAPCPGKKRDGSQCDYEFDLRDLEALRWPAEPDVEPENEVRCVRCRTRHLIDELLLGLSREPSRDSEKLDQILVTVRQEGETTRGLVRAETKETHDLITSEFADVRKFIQLAFVQEWNTAQNLEEHSCPTVFALYPVDHSTLIHKSRLRLQLYCMHPTCWHSVGESGACEIQPLRNNIVTAVRWLRRCVKWLKPAAVLLPSGTQLVGEWSDALHNVAKSAENELKFTSELLKEMKDIPEIGEDGNATFQWSSVGVEQRKHLELAALREFLDDKPFPVTPFGGLVRVRTPEGHILWLCKSHAEEFQRGL